MPERSERRSYFRLDDVLMLHYRPLNDDDEPIAPARAALARAPQVYTASLLAQIEREFSSSIDRLWQSQPETAQALGLLNRKLSIIARGLDDVQGNTPDYEEARVNISGSGMAFECEDALPAGQRVQLDLMLKPSQEELHLVGRVISCDSLPGAPAENGEQSAPHWWMRVDFEDRPDEQERLIQHIIQLQSIRISESRSQSDA